MFFHRMMLKTFRTSRVASQTSRLIEKRGASLGDSIGLNLCVGSKTITILSILCVFFHNDSVP